MWTRLALLIGCAPLACSHSVPMAPASLELLKANPDIPVVYRTTAGPWVDCPGNFGVDTWKRDAQLWESVQEQRTAGLRNAPPVDPARATADRFLLLSRAQSGLPTFRDRLLPAESADLGSLSRRFGTTPVLVLETTRWVLVGCFYSYQPWFNVRATLLETSSGNVLWRDACDGLYPPNLRAEVPLGDLEANGGALYAQLLEARASGCAGELLARFEGGMRSAAGGPAAQ